MVGWHHQLNGHGFGWTPGVGDGREAWCAVDHGVAKSQTRLSNWTELIQNVNQPLGYMCPLPLKPASQPSRVSPSTRLSSLCPYSSFLPACYFTYGNIYVSVLPSHFITPSPSPAVPTSLKQTFFKNWKLIIKFIWKCKGLEQPKQTWKHKIEVT